GGEAPPACRGAATVGDPRRRGLARPPRLRAHRGGGPHRGRRPRDAPTAPARVSRRHAHNLTRGITAVSLRCRCGVDQSRSRPLRHPAAAVAGLRPPAHREPARSDGPQPRGGRDRDVPPGAGPLRGRPRRRTTTEVNSPMSQDRLLLRPADPTRRPRCDAEPGTRIDPIQERNRSRRLLGIVLGALLAVSAVLVVLGIAQIVAWWVPVFAVVGLGAYLVGLRRAEIERRARVTRAATRERRERAEAQTARLRAREATAPAQSGGEGAAALGQAPRSDLET